MQDFLYRGVLDDAAVRFCYTSCVGLCNTAVLKHDCDPLSAHVLCRALGAGVLVSPLLSGDERFTLRWGYSGGVSSVVVDVDSQSRVRGYIQPKQLLQQTEIADEVYGDSGSVSVIRWTPRKTLNSGVVEAGLMDVVDDLAYFFCLSDQVETEMVVLVAFSRDPKRPVVLCQGVMLQALPGCDLERFEGLRGCLRGAACRALLCECPDIDNYFERILGVLSAGDPELTESYSLHLSPAPLFHCRCSPDAILDVVKTFPRSDLEDIVLKGDPLAVTCQFCSARHEVAAAAVAAILDGSAG